MLLQCLKGNPPNTIKVNLLYFSDKLSKMNVIFDLKYCFTVTFQSHVMKKKVPAKSKYPGQN